MGSVIVYDQATVLGLVQELFASAVINGSGKLIVTRQNGTTVDIGYVADHGQQVGLGDDDHTQYAKADGTRGAFATVAQGGKADAARPNINATADVNGGDSTAWIEEFTVTDDGTVTSGWRNRFVGWFRHRVAGVPVIDSLRRMVFWQNEYYELRLAPAKHNTVALRLFVRDTATTQTTARDANVPILQLMDDRSIRTPIWGLHSNGKVRIGANEIETESVIRLTAAAAVPTGTPSGTLIFRTP